jgi:hypothetical protein
LHAVLRWLSLTSTVLLVASCSSTSTSDLGPLPVSARCAANLSADLMTPDAAGGTGRLTVGVNRECDWTAKADVAWMSVTPANGQGEASLTYTVSPNPDGVPRRGGLVVNDNRLEVAQAAAACAFTLSRSSDAFDAGGGTRSVSVAAPSGCAWDAQSGASWLVIVAGAGGSGAGSLEFRVESNTSSSSRTGTLMIAGRTFTVTQAASASVCSIALSPTTHSIGAAAATGSLSVAAPAGCAWTAASDASWLTITAGVSGSGTGTVQYAATANTGPARTATVSIGNQAFTLTQDAVAAPSCSVTVSPLTVSVGSAGGASTVAIKAASPSCPWTAATNTSWITLTGPSSGTGSSQVSFTAAANTSTSSRSGSLTVAGQTVNVNQAAAPTCTFTLSATTQSVPTGGGNSQIGVTASASTCTWTASTSTSWISISSGATDTGNGKVEFSASANTSSSPRTGTLTIAGQTVTITQLGQRIDLTGTISSLSGSCPNRTFTLENRTVRTDNHTDFRFDCNKLKNGDRVDVEGFVQIDNAVLATRVDPD